MPPQGLVPGFFQAGEGMELSARSDGWSLGRMEMLQVWEGVKSLNFLTRGSLMRFDN